MTEQEMQAKIETINAANNKIISDFQAENDRKLKGLVTDAAFKDLQGTFERRFNEVNVELAKVKSPIIAAADGKEPTLHAKAFEKFLRKGSGALAPDEIKVMTISDATTGGYLAPAEFTNELIKNIVEYSPIRSIARVVGTTARSKYWPKKTTSASASWVTEIGTRAETTNPKIGIEEIPTHEMYALAKVSKQDLEDAQFNIQGFVNEEFTEQFGVLEGTAFVAGVGTTQPEGILTNPSVTGFTGVTTSAKIVADDLKQLFFSIKEPYAKNATWLWKRSSTLAISLLKDTVSGNYLWQYGLQLGAPGNVLGRPYIECPDMPAEAASAKAVAFGDFRRGYIIIDRVVIEVLEDPYSSKSTGCIEFSARKRVGGQVVLAEAIKIYTLKA